MAAVHRLSRMEGRASPGASDPVTLYLAEIGRHPLLTPESERELGGLVMAGRRAAVRLDAPSGLDHAIRLGLEAQRDLGRDAAERFVTANLRLVVSVAKRYQATGVPLLDLIQEGNLGLIRAVEKFDPDKGFRFSTYAMWWIRQFIARGIAGTRSSVRLPGRANDELIRLRDAVHRLEQASGRPPSSRELGAETGLSERRILDLLPLLSDPVSLSHSVGDGTMELADFIADDTSRSSVEERGDRLSRTELDAVLSDLDARERQIVALRFGFNGEPCTTSQISVMVGLSRERVRQLERRGMSKLLHPSRPDIRELLGG